MFRRRVSQHKSQYAIHAVNLYWMPFYDENLLRYVTEQNDRRRGVRIALVRIESEPTSRCSSNDYKIPETFDTHDRKVRGSLLAAICQRKERI